MIEDLETRDLLFFACGAAKIRDAVEIVKRGLVYVPHDMETEEMLAEVREAAISELARRIDAKAI